MVFINDPNSQVIEPLFARKTELEELYSTDLMQNGGRLTGWQVCEEDHIMHVSNSLLKIQEEQAKDTESPILYAVGDGNHSLNTAKYVWDSLKTSLSEE